MAHTSTLRRRLIVGLGLMALGSLTIAIGSIVAVNALHQDLGSAVQGYRQLRQLFNVGFLISKARDATAANPPQSAQAITALQSARIMLNAQGDRNAVDEPPAQWIDEPDRDQCRDLIRNAIQELSNGAGSSASLILIFPRMSRIADEVRQSILQTRNAADRKQHVTLICILCLCGIVVVSAVLIGIGQYRRVIGPLHQIGVNVRTFAAGGFDCRIALTGDREFVTLSADFNKMADELSALYRNLEAKVAAKSKELARSQQLASVGYLAAGIAHEINNPLGIIAGYGERAIQQLSQGLNESSLSKTQKAFAVICEEAFRCKEITERLLSLAKPGNATRRVYSLATIAEAVVSTLSGLGAATGRSMILEIEPDADLSVLADENEMKQVMLNLIINALEAVDEQGGQVRVAVARRNDEIELTVIDNGPGMTSQTLEHIFQPFFTDKRGKRAGVGLGLSIAEAIVAGHHGRIHAHSDGSGKGSRFTVNLPAAGKEPALANI